MTDVLPKKLSLTVCGTTQVGQAREKKENNVSILQTTSTTMLMQ